MSQKAQLILAENYEKQQSQEKFELAQIIGTTKGFYQYYFDTLPEFKYRKECFENVNDLHFSVFKEYKYASYDNFIRRISRKQK